MSVTGPGAEFNPFFQDIHLNNRGDWFTLSRPVCRIMEKFSGEMAEWSKAHAWKVCKRQRFEGSNPSLSAKLTNRPRQGTICFSDTEFEPSKYIQLVRQATGSRAGRRPRRGEGCRPESSLSVIPGEAQRRPGIQLFDFNLLMDYSLRSPCGRPTRHALLSGICRNNVKMK